MVLEGRRPHPARARPRAGQPADPRVRGSTRRPPARPHRWARAKPAPKRALFVSSPIGLGHARRDVAIAAELRRLTLTSKSTGSPSIPSPGSSKTPGSACIRPASAWRANRPTSSRKSGEHRLHCFQAWRRMDEILLADFMVFHDVVTRHRLRPGDRRRGVGDRLLPAREPELKRFAYCWLTDFVGWLPMPEGGDSRGVPHRRLQRRDDRTHRPLPAGPRPGAVRRQPRRHRPRQLRPRPPAASATGPTSTTSSPAMSPASTPQPSPTATSSATNSAIAPDEQSASSPSAAPVSAATCSGG